jgi:prevent-host-death family protein
MRTLSALSVRRKFGGVIDEVCRDKEPVVITRANKPLVVMLPYEEYGKLSEGKERQKKLRRVFSEIREWSNEHEEAVKGLNAVEMIRGVREGR